jgi:hypothetical protein
MLSLLIPRKESIKNENIDVYLQPLVEELELLWVGVPTINVSRLMGSQRFLLKTICLWSIHDYHAYDLFVDCQMKGYLAYPLCGSNVDIRHSSHLEKNVYLGHRRYFGKHHPYQRNYVNFKGQPKFRHAPI